MPDLGARVTRDEPLQETQTVIHVPFRARSARVTIALVSMNVAIYVFGLLSGPDTEEWLVTRFGQDRLEVWSGEYWRLVTGVFLHAGYAHLVLNMLALGLLGRLLERLLGHGRFLLLYGVSGVSGSLAFQVFSAAGLGLGASGAVYGLFGAFLVFKSLARGRGRIGPALRSYVLWTAFVLLFDQVVAMLIQAGAGIGVASSAHFGGFVAGSVLGYSSIRLFFPVASRHRITRWALHAGLLVLLGVLTLHTVTVQPQVHPMHYHAVGPDPVIFERLQAGDPEGAVERWLAAEDRGGSIHRSTGYLLYEELMAEGKEGLAGEVLDRLIEDTDAALEEAREAQALEPDLYNERAWYSALRGTELVMARALADHAVRAMRASMPEGPLQWLLPLESSRQKLGAYINTRGWVEYRLGEFGDALRDLREAAELLPVGSNFLYLALAYYGMREIDMAREAARMARKTGGLTRYEGVLLEELEDNLRAS